MLAVRLNRSDVILRIAGNINIQPGTHAMRLGAFYSTHVASAQQQLVLAKALQPPSGSTRAKQQLRYMALELHIDPEQVWILIVDGYICS